MCFYFCFGILLGFINLITIPKFSTGMPCSGGSTSNNMSEQVFIVEYPIATFYSNFLRWKIMNILRNNENINEFYDNTVKSPIFNDDMRGELSRIIEEIAESDDQTSTINKCISDIHSSIKQKEQSLKDELSQGDKKNDGTVTKEYAKQCLLNTSFLVDPLNSEQICDFVIDNNLNDEHQVVYDNLLKNFMVNMKQYFSSNRNN
ncbi:uncharacterized protein LOC126901748 [Daktulosphaira vitifoliae]|uniref:uncharacterized protein LOC126901748 n=1 Tax=Daktulosphaira vitifoliae TaxID=58002 RepID=UPI0021AABFAC|nr:uncharacterized protein LOC126901748 [Daktulosphaira vitifoliae]